jgi:hypothetical protein
MTEELGRIWKEMVVTESGLYPGIQLKRLRKATKPSIGIISERSEFISKSPSACKMYMDRALKYYIINY